MVAIDRKRRSVALVAAVGIVISVIAWQFRLRFPFDDVFISFRYAEHVAFGHGFVWNVGGPHTEGYTNFLFILLLAGIRLITTHLLAATQLIGLLSTIGSGILLFLIVSKERRSVAGYFAVAIYFLTPLTWINALSGMETSLFVLWCVLAIFFTQREQFASAFGAVLLAALTRPEGAMLGAIIFTTGLIRSRTSASRLLWPAGVFLVALLVYASWKWQYFGTIIPNSFYVKVLDSSERSHGIFHGMQYVRLFVVSMIVPIVCSLGIRSWRNGTIIVATTWTLFLLGFYLFVRPLEGLYDRFLMPAFPALCILASIGTCDLLDRFRLSAIAFIALLISHVGLCYFTPRTEQSLAAHEHVWDANMDRVVSELKMLPNFDSLRLAYGDAGYVVYRSEIQHIDLFGLNDTRIAHAKTVSDRKNIVLEEKPDLLLIPIRSNAGSDEWVEDAYGIVRDSSFTTVAVMDAFPYPLAWVLNKNSHYYLSCTAAIEQELHKPGSYLVPPPTIR